MKRLRFWCLTALLPLSLSAPLLNAVELKPFKAKYQAEIGSFSATATRELKVTDSGNYQLSQEANNFFASVVETSQFSTNGNLLVSNRYEYLRKAFGSKRHALLEFDWDKKSVTNDVEGKPWSYDISEGTLDKLNFQLRLRLDLQQGHYDQLSYPVADGGVLKTYQFKVLGKETLETELGTVNTVKVQRIYSKKKDKETWLWFSTDHDYLLVRYLQTKDNGKKKTELVVTDISDIL